MPKTHKIVEFSKRKSKLFVTVNKKEKSTYNFQVLCFKCNFCVMTIVKILDVSESSFRNAFIEHMGQTPKHWMRETRVELAKQMLSEGKRGKEIAENLGYHDYPHMAKDFKRCLGRYPKLMRAELLVGQGAGKELLKAG